jgi:ubiquitin carboxyl-terminal hydrolase L3
MPLESNPEVMNPYIEKLGLRTDLFCFQEVLSTEEWALAMIPQPVLGILMLY